MSFREVAVSLGMVLMTMSLLQACLWDRDTAKAEAEGIHDVIPVITGRFARNPDRYYQMRLDRVIAELEQDPSKLALYDDVAVACDRLGRQDDAIQWMKRKREQLEAVDDRTHRYRYFANLGTFWAHRWLRADEPLAALAQLDTAIDLIGKAIALNPEAHFGREHFQLRLMKRIRNSVKGEAIGPPDDGVAADADATNGEEAIGIAGLIALGAAWESPDVFNALARALNDEERTSIAFLAQLRRTELEEAGQSLRLPMQLSRWQIEDQSTLTRYFKEARAEADKWHKDRTAFMEAAFNKGHHPDTHPQFWDGFDDGEPPELPGHGSIQSLLYANRSNPLVSSVKFFLAITIPLVACWMIHVRFLKWKKRKSEQD